MSKIDKGALAASLARTAACLAVSPKAIAAIALVAVAGAANAQLSGSYEHAGSSVGYDIGRALGDGKNQYTQGIASTIGQLLGSQMGRSVDESSKMTEEATARARQDAIYDAERRRIDPNYSGYSSSASRASSSISSWSSGSYSAGVDAQQAQLAREWQQRNGQRSR